VIFLKKIIIADYYGFCMGVKRAISMTEVAAARDDNVTIFKKIVHNEAVVEKFMTEGIGQSDDVQSVENGTLIIPAHGASPDIIRAAVAKGLSVIDATCPLVIRIHKIVKRLAERGYHIIHFGDSRHDETIGIVGHAPDKVTVVSSAEELDRVKPGTGKIALTSQTTARVNDFVEIEKKSRRLFPQIEVFNTICNATSHRQAAVLELAPRVDIMLVVGSSSSANSKRMVQIAGTVCPRSYLVNSADEINPEWFRDRKKPVNTVGLSAGASTPDFLIAGAIERLREIAGGAVEVVFPGNSGPKRKIQLKQ
jgi:4-hydroxy-3-methylbut-2-enyl diphosphate reductase